MKILIYIIPLFLCITSCDSFLEYKDKDQVIPSTLEHYNELIYGELITKSSSSVCYNLHFLTDDIGDQVPSGYSEGDDRENYLSWYTWAREPQISKKGDETIDPAWEFFYHQILMCNIIEEDVKALEEDTEGVKYRLLGEVQCIRGMAYFYLVNMYASPYDPATCETAPGIPINLEITADDKVYRRSSLKVVYEQIVGDLEKAIPLLEENPINNGKTRFSAIAAKALLAKVYLYMQEWDLAIAQAQEVIKANPALFDLREAGENPVIYTESPLAYWTADNVPGIGYLSEKNSNVLFVNGINEVYRILSGDNAQTVFYPSETLFNSYEPGDVRRYYFMRRNTRGRIRYMKNRYYRLNYLDFVVQLSSEYGYTRVLRTEDMYLILAEAYAHKTDGIKTAVGYLNTLREVKFRAQDFETTGRLDPEDFNQQTLLETIWTERRREFCFEEQRWFDLRRTTRPSITHYGITGSSTLQKDDPRYVLQIPQKELNVNPEIGANPR
mgnify:CR=1 FL=1